MPKARARRGRPSAASLPLRILEGVNGDSQYKCRHCNREFPRSKSLQTHIRTHTGEKPYVCDYPGCDAAFKQSGQLRSHAYRHTGEKPFCCSVEGCEKRFRHPNRQCSDHKLLKLVRDDKEVIRDDLENLSEKEILWIQRYKEKKLAKGSSSPKEHSTSRKRSFSSIHSSDESSDQEASKNSLSLVPITNCETNGHRSFSGSEQSSPDHCKLHEEISRGNESFAVTPKRKNSSAVIDLEDISKESSDQDPSRNSLSTVPMTNCETSGYSSFSGSEQSPSPSHYEVHEETNKVDESFAVSAKRKFSPEDISTANILVELQNGVYIKSSFEKYPTGS